MENFLKLRENKAVIILICLLLGFGAWNLSKGRQPKSESLKVESVKKKSEPSDESFKANSNKILVVDIQGAIKNPGIYRLKNGAITQEVIKMAGGLLPDADVKQINQAQRVTDQMQIIVPKVGETGNANAGSSNDKKIVNINTAKVEDFQSVSGIGPKKAEKIIEFREQNGNFNDLKDLTKVSGIGDKTLESLKDQLTV